MRTIKKSSNRRSRLALGLVPVLVAGWIGTTALPASAHPWVVGNVYAAISNGQYQQFTSTGTPGDLLQAGAQDNPENPDGKFTTGCAFNPAGFPPVAQNLYTTLWSERKISVVQDGATHPVLLTIDTTAGTGTTGHPESIAFNTAGDFFVGLVDEVPGTPNLLKYDKNHVLIGTWTLTTGGRGVDAIDLAANQTTIYYTSEDNVIRTFDILTTSLNGTGTQGVFHTGALTSRYYGLRLLQGGNPFGGGGGTGFLMVADTTDIKVLNAAGSQINTYGAGVTPHPTFGNGWFSVSIDSGGSQFVAGDFYSGRVVKFNANGTVANNFVANAQPFRVNGVCVRGEITTGVVPFPAIGFFIVGDVSAGFANFPTVGNNVYFWGNDWAANNTLSGPNTGNMSSFKGFGETTSPATPFCNPPGPASTWASGGGASTAPPATLPNVVAVIVTSTISGSGSIKAQGAVRAIILVQVNQGTYNNSSGGVGTGTVIQVVCKGA